MFELGLGRCIEIVQMEIKVKNMTEQRYVGFRKKWSFCTNEVKATMGERQEARLETRPDAIINIRNLDFIT